LGKIEMSEAAASSLQITDKAPQLDDTSKEILSNKEFLAILLKHTAKEFKDMSYQEIADCIEADKISNVTEVAPGRTNQNRIEGLNPEFKALNEMMSRFDVYFKVINPKLSNEEVACYIYVDVEAQGNYRPGYPIEKRGIYYMSRMIGSQIAAPTAKTDYSVLAKVYNIFICRENVPKDLRNTISQYELVNTWNSKDIETQPGDNDLMTMVIIRLGDPDDDNTEEIIRIMNALFYPRTKKSYKVLENHVKYSKSLSQEVKKMSGLGEMVFMEGIEEGIEKGIEKGVVKGKAEIILNMYEAGYPVEEIAKIAKITKESVEKILAYQEVLV